MSVEPKIRAIIKKNGYIKIDEIMRESLSNNPDSYYRSTENIGKDGDFITSPEISQLFGEIIALWAIEKWQELESPEKFALLELGPGQGQLMQDFLRVAKLAPGFFEAAQLYLLEINPYFIAKQKKKLNEYNKDIRWIKTISQLPEIPLITISNEFFDALPIKQYIKANERWFESVMVIDQIDDSIKYNKIEINALLEQKLSSTHINAIDGAIVESSQDSLEIMQVLSEHLNSYRGACLSIDYGYDIEAKIRTQSQYVSSLQAIQNHKYQAIVSTFGAADLTAHVDFNALKQIARESNNNKPASSIMSSQREFLFKYGIKFRLQLLKNNCSSPEQDILDRQVLRLTSSQHMGELFKVFEYKII